MWSVFFVSRRHLSISDFYYDTLLCCTQDGFIEREVINYKYTFWTQLTVSLQLYYAASWTTEQYITFQAMKLE